MGGKSSKPARSESGTMASSVEPDAIVHPQVHDSEMADIHAKDCIAAATRDAVGELGARVQSIKNDLELFNINAKHWIDSGASEAMVELNISTHKLLSDIESVSMVEKNSIVSCADDAKRELEATCINIKTAIERLLSDIESVSMVEKDSIVSCADDAKRELEATCINMKTAIERSEINAMNSIDSSTETGLRELLVTTRNLIGKLESVAEENIRKINTMNDKECTNVRDEIQAWLIDHYQTMCVAPVSMLNTDIDVPLERIYVAPSIKDLKRGQENINGGHDMHPTSQVGTDVSTYNGLLLRERKPVNTIYIQGDPGCGKTTFATKLVLDWCKVHSTRIASKEDTSSETTSVETPNQTTFRDLDTLRDYTFLFFVSLRDYSGSMCNVSQMIEDAIKRNKLPWGDSVWKHKCIVLTDAADEWYHPEIPFPPPCNSACKCRKDRSMPQYLQRTNITNIITARPWKFAEHNMSDTLTRIFEILGVLDYQTLAKNMFRVLGEKDCISEEEQEAKFTDFITKMSTQNIGHLITIPAICVQFVHQFYVGRLMERSLCAIYSNMLDMHIARGLQKLQIKEFDKEEKTFGDVADILRTETTEYLQGNLSLVCSASHLAFTMLTDTCKQSSLVIPENKITNQLKGTELDYLLQTGIITKKKSLALCSQKNVSYMFVHKTIQEFLASLYIAMHQTEMDAILHDIHLAYRDRKSILDIGQLFIFTCGMCPLAAEQMSKHISDVITSYMKSTLHDIVSDFVFSKLSYEAQGIILDGYTEGEANGQQCLHLTFSHIIYVANFTSLPLHGLNVFKTLIDMNISNIVSIRTLYSSSGYRLQEVISQSRETLSYLILRRSGHIDLKGLKLKYFECEDYDVYNLDCSNMVQCRLETLTPSTERVVFKTLSVTGEHIKFLSIERCASINLLCEALPNMRSLHSLTLFLTTLGNTQLHDYLPQSIREVHYNRTLVSCQVIRSMVKWSKSRDACVKCTLFCCAFNYDSADKLEVHDWIKQQDGIDIHIDARFNIVWTNRINCEVHK